MKAIKIEDYKNKTIHDFDVITKVIQGEKGLFEILMRRNNQRLYRVICGYISSDAIIKDIMQETYIKAYEKLETFNQKSSFSTWLIRIGINLALQEIRSKKHKVIVHPNSEYQQLKDISTAMTPEKSIVQKEAQWVLEKTISELPEKYRVIYILSEVEDMKIKDISDCLDISVSNVKVRIHRAKHMLKDKLYELSQKPNVFEFESVKCDLLVENVMKNL